MSMFQNGDRVVISDEREVFFGYHCTVLTVTESGWCRVSIPRLHEFADMWASSLTLDECDEA